MCPDQRFIGFAFLSDENVIADWRRTMANELKFGVRSANRKFHEPLLAEIAMNDEKRAELFDAVDWLPMEPN